MTTRDEILSMAREAGLLTVTVSKAVGEIRKDRIVNFANVVTATERAARQEAQQRLADAQELLAKSGLAHRKAVQAAVAEAVAAEREALRETLGAADVLAVNFMRVAGIDKHAARQCADVVRELVANHAAGDRARGTQ